MSLNKVNYVDNVTIIGADNLNEIQDAIISLESGGIAVTPSGATPEATSGTLTDAEYATLIASLNNYILFNGEYYYLADLAHTPGMITYSHTGYNGSTGVIKYFNITITTKAWTLTSYTPPQMSVSGTTLTITGVN